MKAPAPVRSIAIAIGYAAALLSPPAVAAPARTGSQATSETLHSILLPGGVEGIRRALGDRSTTPPATIGVEIARRFYNGTPEATSLDGALERLRAWLRDCERSDICAGSSLPPDEIPLPGAPDFWHEVVFERRVRPEHTMLGVLGHRRPALLYTALLSAREEVRAWLLARPDLLKQLSEADCGALVVAAPYLRIEDGRWRLPGGPEAAPIWLALSEAAADDPARLLLAILRARDGMLAYAIELVATLTPEQQRVVLALTEGESVRIAAARDLLEAIGPIGRWWHPGALPFWRPAIDPAFLFAQIGVDAGRLRLPAGRALWDLVFDGTSLDVKPAAARAAWQAPGAVQPAWLVDRLLSAPTGDRQVRYEQILFASRWMADASEADAADAVVVLRGYARFPQLLRMLDRIGAADVSRVASLVRRADVLSRAGGDRRARAALLRWQCALVLVDYAARLGAATPGDVERVLDGLAAPGETAADEGPRLIALLRWLGISSIDADPATRRLERAFVAALTHSRLAEGRQVVWEGTTYRIDFAAAERSRLARVRGRDARAWIDSAAALLALADGLAAAHAPGPDVTAVRATVTAAVDAAGLRRPPDIGDELGLLSRESAEVAGRLLDRTPPKPALAVALADLGNALAAQGLVELAYAVSMGWAESLPLTAAAASRRHAYTIDARGGFADASWIQPVIVTGRDRPWHVAGSLLGLDVALSPVALRRVSLKPLSAAPALNTGDRNLFVGTIAALDRRAFTDEAQQQAANLMARGRARLRDARTGADVAALVEQAGGSPLRQALAAWTAEGRRGVWTDLLTLTEVMRLGLAGDALPEALRGWGMLQVPLTGRLTAGDLPALPWERYASRSIRLLACALPDLQLTLATGLADLRLPAVLVPDLMAAATADLVNLAVSRHPDDWHALAARAQAVDPEAIERYLALLAGGGPLRAADPGRSQ